MPRACMQFTLLTLHFANYTGINVSHLAQVVIFNDYSARLFVIITH